MAGLGVVLAVGVSTACGVTGAVEEPNVGGDAPLTTTHHALAAAVIDHMSQFDVAHAVPLLKDDGTPYPGTLGVEVSFRAYGDDIHVALGVSKREQDAELLDCDSDELKHVECEETNTTVGRLSVSWEKGAPEEDPGVVQVGLLRSDGLAVTASSYGCFVKGDPRAGRAFCATEDTDTTEPLDIDDMIALISDPDIDFKTSKSLVDAGDNISDGVWLDWYGQGNGAAKPENFDPTTAY